MTTDARTSSSAESTDAGQADQPAEQIPAHPDVVVRGWPTMSFGPDY